MSAYTSKQIRQQLHTEVVSWFASPEPQFNVPIEASNIKRYSTAPDDESSTPNWIVITTARERLGTAVFGGRVENPIIAIWLLSRIGSDEASKEASLDWIDDATEMLTVQLAESLDHTHWISINILNILRDNDPAYHGRYRTSVIVAEIEKR